MNATLDNSTVVAPDESPAQARLPVERTFRSFDGTELFYRHWAPRRREGLATEATVGWAPPTKSSDASTLAQWWAEPTLHSDPTPRRAVVLFHRGHEHSGRWQAFVEALDLAGTAVFAWDARGHGRSPGERGWAPDFATVVKDADEFVRHVCAEHQIAIEDVAVVAHSVGAVVAAAWVHDYAPPIRAMVLATPAFRVKLYVPLAIPSLRALQRVKRKSFVKSYVRSKMLTHDADQAAAYDADPLISKQIAVNILLDLHDASGRLIADAGAIATPTLVLGAGSDRVVKNSAAARFFERLSSPTKEMFVFPGMGHAIFHERERGQVVERVRSFLECAFAAPAGDRMTPLKDYTRREHDKLASPRPAYCPIGWSFKAQTLMLKSVLKVSEGVRVGWRTGFDSGQSLDYVYRNRARGFTPIGRLVDYFYLNAIGWRGIRQRRVHLDNALRRAIEAVLAEGKTARVLDIASDRGAYVLETLASLPAGADVSAVLRDRSLPGLAEGRLLAEELGVANVTFEPGDAFSTEEIGAIDPRPNVAVVSGLYELFPDNEMIERSLAGLARAVEPGGWLIYTNQPWHPQIEMIARTLVNRDGQPWVMRRRTQAEMDDLVRRAGFEKLGMDIDRWGIFTVSVARRV